MDNGSFQEQAMRDQTLIETWSQLLITWSEAHTQALERQQALDQKMTNHFVYDKAAPEQHERQQVDELWQHEERTRTALDDFVKRNTA
jgi:hypothetical protein